MIKDSILVGYVCGNTLDRCFVPSLFGLLNYDAMNRRCLMGLAYEGGPFVDDNRNTLVRTMLKTEAEWFLLLDTDTQIAPTAPYVLLDAAKKQGVKIITGLQFSFDQGMCIPLWWDKVADNGEFSRIPEIKFGELYKLAACGMGCCLIHREVFETLQKETAWGLDTWTWFGRDECHKPGAELTSHFGEDMTFCKRAAEKGFEILGHAGVEARHAKRFEVGFEEFMILWKANYKGVQG